MIVIICCFFIFVILSVSTWIGYGFKHMVGQSLFYFLAPIEMIKWVLFKEKSFDDYMSVAFEKTEKIIGE